VAHLCDLQFETAGAFSHFFKDCVSGKETTNPYSKRMMIFACTCILLCVVSLASAGREEAAVYVTAGTVGATVSAVIPTVAHAAIPLVMAKTGVIVSGVGTFHGAATVAVQAVALAPIAPLAIGGAVLVVSGVAVHRNRELVEAIGTSIANWAQDRVVAFK
jgi:hypothetical protein